MGVVNSHNLSFPDRQETVDLSELPKQKLLLSLRAARQKFWRSRSGSCSMTPDRHAVRQLARQLNPVIF